MSEKKKKIDFLLVFLKLFVIKKKMRNCNCAICHVVAQRTHTMYFVYIIKIKNSIVEIIDLNLGDIIIR
jgi:hypothetical protein